MIVAAALCLAVVSPGAGPTGRESDLSEARASYEKVVDQIIAFETRATPEVRLLFEDGDAGYHNLSLIHFAKTGHVLMPGRIDDFTNPVKFAKEIRETDFALTLTPTSPDVQPGYRLALRFPSSRDPAGGDRMVSSDSSMLKVASFPWKNGQLHLYRNSSLTRAAN
jgi:hypothetical protein